LKQEKRRKHIPLTQELKNMCKEIHYFRKNFKITTRIIKEKTLKKSNFIQSSTCLQIVETPLYKEKSRSKSERDNKNKLILLIMS